MGAEKLTMLFPYFVNYTCYICIVQHIMHFKYKCMLLNWKVVNGQALKYHISVMSGHISSLKGITKCAKYKFGKLMRYLIETLLLWLTLLASYLSCVSTLSTSYEEHWRYFKCLNLNSKTWLFPKVYDWLATDIM